MQHLLKCAILRHLGLLEQGVRVLPVEGTALFIGPFYRHEAVSSTV